MMLDDRHELQRWLFAGDGHFGARKGRGVDDVRPPYELCEPIEADTEDALSDVGDVLGARAVRAVVEHVPRFPLVRCDVRLVHRPILRRGEGRDVMVEVPRELFGPAESKVEDGVLLTTKPAGIHAVLTRPVSRTEIIEDEIAAEGALQVGERDGRAEPVEAVAMRRNRQRRHLGGRTMPHVRVHHLALRTQQLRKVVRFYCGVLGLAVLREQRLSNGKIRSVWLAADRTIVMIEAAETDEPCIPPRSNELVAFKVAKRDVARMRARLLLHRVRIESETQHSCYFRDPDGRRLALTTYPWPK